MPACHRSSLSTILTDLILALGIAFILTSLTCSLVLLKATPISALRSKIIPPFWNAVDGTGEFKEDLHSVLVPSHSLVTDILCLGKMTKDEDARVLDGLWLGLSKHHPRCSGVNGSTMATSQFLPKF